MLEQAIDELIQTVVEAGKTAQSEIPKFEVEAAIPYTPYTESDEFQQEVAQIKQSLAELQSAQEAERRERLDAQKASLDAANQQRLIDERRSKFNSIIGIISAVAAVIGAIFAVLSFFG